MIKFINNNSEILTNQERNNRLNDLYIIYENSDYNNERGSGQSYYLYSKCQASGKICISHRSVNNFVIIVFRELSLHIYRSAKIFSIEKKSKIIFKECTGKIFIFEEKIY